MLRKKITRDRSKQTGSKLRIAFFEWPGIASRSLRFIESLNSLGHEVFIIRGVKPSDTEETHSDFRQIAPLLYEATFAIHPRNPLYELVKSHPLGKSVLTLITPSMTNGGFGNPYTLIPNWLSAYEILLAAGCDIVWATDLDALPPACWAGANANIPVIYQADELFQALDYINPIWQEEWNQIAEKFIPLVSSVVAVSEDIAEVFRTENNARHTAVVHNLTHSSRTAAPATIREGIELDPQDTLAVIVGNVVPKRGIEFAISALSADKSLHIAIVGGGKPEYIASLNELASSFGVSTQLHIVGNVEYAYLADFLSTADINLMPYSPDVSRNHKLSMPNKLFDGLSAGLPTVACHDTSAGTFLEESGLGLTFVQDNVDNLLQVLDKACALKEYVGTQRERFYWDQNLVLIDALLKSVAK